MINKQIPIKVFDWPVINIEFWKPEANVINNIYEVWKKKGSSIFLNINCKYKFCLDVFGFASFLHYIEDILNKKRKSTSQEFDYSLFLNLSNKEKLFKQIIQNREWNRIPELGEIFAENKDFFEILFKKFREVTKI